MKNTNLRMKIWCIGYFIIVGIIFIFLGNLVLEVDPFFHYKAPDTEKYYYDLDNEWSQNDGIAKYFQYDAMITGTSMAQNFKSTEFDAIFGVHSVKTAFSYGSYKEINDYLKRALTANGDLKTVIRSLDMDCFFSDSDDVSGIASGMDYLYDDNDLNDFQYVLKRDIIFERSYSAIHNSKLDNFIPGISSFDEYSNWMKAGVVFGKNSLLPNGISNYNFVSSYLSDSDKQKIKRNITENVTALAEEYPDVEFYYYITPYSAVWWNYLMRYQELQREIQAEQYIIEMILKCNNIHLYSFNTNTELTTDLNNYKDSIHYGEWVNSKILQWMHEGTGLLTEENYHDYLSQEFFFYATYDYTQLLLQEDYEDDYDAETVMLGTGS